MVAVALRVLGPLHVEVDGRPVEVAGPRRQALLALLLLNANHVVTVTRAIEALWGDDAPASARAQIHSLVSALRRQLVATGEGGPAVETRAQGYVLVVDPAAVDVCRFGELVTGARAAIAAGRHEEAAGRYREALRLWRGPALDGIDAPFAPAEAVRLDEERLVATEESVEAELLLGRHTEVAPELRALVAANPFRERLQRALMLALYRCGRRAEGLDVYRSARRTMVEELGLDPSRELQDLQLAMLKDEPSLALDGPPPAAPGDPVAVAEPGPVPTRSPRGRRARSLRSLAGFAGLAAAVVAVAVAAAVRVAPPAAVAVTTTGGSGCAPRPMAITDFHGRVFDHVSHCSTVVDQPVYANPRDAAPLEEVSLMFRASDVWVICQLAGRADPVVQGRRSHWWFYTQGDTTNRPNRYGYTNAWAFLPATAVAQATGDRPVRGIPICPAKYVTPGAPAVVSPDLPADGLPHGAAGAVGTFVLTPVAGTGDLAGFMYDIDGADDQLVASTGPARVRVALPAPGPHELSVWARARSGSMSPVARYTFTVGRGPATSGASGR